GRRQGVSPLESKGSDSAYGNGVQTASGLSRWARSVRAGAFRGELGRRGKVGKLVRHGPRIHRTLAPSAADSPGRRTSGTGHPYARTLLSRARLFSACPPVYLSRSEEHTSELQSLAYLVCRLLLEKKNTTSILPAYISQERLTRNAE